MRELSVRERMKDQERPKRVWMKNCVHRRFIFEIMEKEPLRKERILLN